MPQLQGNEIIVQHRLERAGKPLTRIILQGCLVLLVLSGRGVSEEPAQFKEVPVPGWLAKSSAEMMAMRDGRVPGEDFTQRFSKQTARIVVRDGAELYTEIYTPLIQKGPLPIILVRSPYGLNPDKYGYAAWLREYPHLIRDGYIFVFQDTRGRGGSTGHYVSLSPMRDKKVSKSTDESTDTYDTIDWIIAHVPRNNGRVGTLGISYGGFLTTRALVDPHPALKAASPQATCADMFVGDDFHHNGAFRLDYAFGWIGAMERGFDRSSSFSRYDHYDLFLELGPLSNINKNIFHGQAPSWNAFDEHPNDDSFWRSSMCSVLPYVQSPVKVPTLNIAGWFDAEDHYGAMETYKQYEKGDTHGLNNLVVGPWYHGGWTFSEGRTLGAVDFGSDTGRWYREHVEAPWFAHWLKDGPKVDLPEVLSFRTGANQWKHYDSWPPKTGIQEAKLYLHAAGALSFEPPQEASDAHDQYVSDPSKPVPFVPRPITRNGWPEWQLADQRFVDGRPDVLTYQTGVLEKDVTISGEPVIHLFAATTGSDSDWVVKLIDVHPEVAQPENMGGFEFMLAEEVFRARYRNSFSKPEAVVPRQVTPYTFGLRSRDHTFKAGHRIMVQIQSSWFPLIDRNPQTYIPNIYEAVQGDFQASTQSIYRSADHASYLILPLNTRDDAADSYKDK
jgi:putative CocE/NonD family hydrolase